MSSIPGQATGQARRSTWVISADTSDGFFGRLREVWQYRRILGFFSMRAIESLYRKTYLGGWWLLIRTLLPLLVGTYVFGSVIQVPTNGLPYFLFFLAGQIPWGFFEGGLGRASRGIDSNRQLLTKLYIPRVILPLGQMAAGIVEPLVIVGIMIVALVYYRRVDGVWYVEADVRALAALASVLVILCFTFGLSLFTSVWQGRARDMRFALRHLLGFWQFLTPVAYPATQVPLRFRWLIYLNPLTGPVETFKWAVLKDMDHSWGWFAYSIGVTVALVVSGMWYFARSESDTMDKL